MKTRLLPVVDKIKGSKKLGILLAVLIIVLVTGSIVISGMESSKTVDVLKLSKPVSVNAPITAADVEVKQMYYKEFQEAGVQKLSDGSTRRSIVLASEKSKVIGKLYAAYYLRQGLPLYWDMVVKEQPKKHSYLYKLDGEFLNTGLDASDFGEIIVPGDSINVRVKYNDNVYDLPPEEQYLLQKDSTRIGGGTSGSVTRTKQEMLFNEVRVLDMLNSEEKSIFDIYYDFLSKPKTEQAKLLNDSTFAKSVKPTKVMLSVTAEEVDRMVYIEGNSPSYKITLLPRTGNNAILESLSDVSKLVKTLPVQTNTGKK